ncbi:hypothetical protein GW950_00165 [Candidatus Wolfebacteria bacterium]|nr:hypothetical protein [Candidatus Wolfebacteria bacterium]
MKKITVNKSDEVVVIVEKIIESEDKAVILSIPRFSHISGSISNFHLLKREGDALGKSISIESVDDRVIELAEMSGIPAVNPFFTKSKRQFSDIVAPVRATASKIKRPKPIIGSLKRKKKQELDEEYLEMAPENNPTKTSEEIPEGMAPETGDTGMAPEMETRDNFYDDESNLVIDIPKPKPIFKIITEKFSFPGTVPGYKSIIWIGGALTVLLLGYSIATILPRAKVVIIPQTQDWVYNDSIVTAKSATVNTTNMSIPNQAFSQEKNASLEFDATGRKQVEDKATGIITVYNSYSSEDQPLVIRTRFMTPDGKLFRLVDDIVVPGASIVEGKIVPSSIDAKVVADKAGPEYNIGPVKLFNIPGFKGSPKYQAFYGESIGNIEGGFIGELAYPTDEDIEKAKSAASDTLETMLNTELVSQIPQEFKILDGSKNFEILTQEIDDKANEDGKFRVFTEAKMTILSFKEDDINNVLENRAIKENGEEFNVKSFNLDYGLARADFNKGVLTFPVNYQAVMARNIDVESLKESILGKSEIDLKTTIFGLPGLKSATVSLWPFWVKNVPELLDKVEIIVE